MKVKSAALNYNDIWGMRGVPVAVPLPHVSGSDAAGDVIAVGDDVKNIKVGDKSSISLPICHAEFVKHVLMVENLIVLKEQFGDSKLVQIGEHFKK